ncbi:MAG: GntR family transcriptional regulator [Nocardioidaceae bacterium]
MTSPGSISSVGHEARNPYEVVAVDLRAQILAGRLPAGSLLPSHAELTRQYGVAAGTAHRASTLLREWGMIAVRRGHRAVVLGVGGAEGAGQSTNGASHAYLTGFEPQVVAAEVPAVARNIVDVHVRHLGEDFARFCAEADLTDGADLRRLLVAAVRRRGGNPAQIAEYEMEIRHPADPAANMTFVVSHM